MSYDVDKNNEELKGWDGGKYFGQWETDKVIDKYFPIRKGVCVEVGAANGIKGSNTLYFEQRGWNVLCIEPNPKQVKSLLKHRKNNCFKAVGTDVGWKNLVIFDVGEKNIYSSLTSLQPDERLVEEHKHIINRQFEREVQVDTLTNILKEKEVPKHIDFISVDTEGTELDVLKSFDFEKYDVKLFVIENNFETPDIEKFMNEKGYDKVERYKINDFYLKRSHKKIFSMGEMYVSDFVKNEYQFGNKSEMCFVIDEEIGAPRLEKAVDPNRMYGKYWYRSGINSTMTKHLKSIAEELTSLVDWKKHDVFLDIACNDGTLLKFVDDNMLKVGVDPADDSYANESKQIADDIIQDYFSYDTFKKSKYGNCKVKIATTISMFYDLEYPKPFLQGVYDILDDDGLYVIQMSYTPLMLKQLAFDNICHEHVYYYSLTSMKNLVEPIGFKIVDCKLNDTNGGSFRIYLMKQDSKKELFTMPYRDVAQYRIESILSYEEKIGITTIKPYKEFYTKISELKDKTVDFIKGEKAKGKVIWGYGASTKGNTLLQFYELDNTLIDGIAERSPYKFGLKTVGTNIPIYSEDEMREVKPDYLLILPWHFINEFKEREQEYLNNGGKFIVPCPEFRVIEK